MSTIKQFQIVLVEDDDILAHFLMNRLMVEKIKPIRYANGLDAVNGILEKPKVDLILLDLMLPDIDGFEVLKRVREDPRGALIPVVVLSNFIQEHDIEWGKKLGVEKFLNKSRLVPAEIVNIVLDAIAQKSATEHAAGTDDPK